MSEPCQKLPFTALLKANRGEFQRFRKLVEIGNKIKMLFSLIPYSEQQKVLKHYKEENITWLEVWLREKRKD